MDPYTWVQIILVVVAAVYSYANRPKITPPTPVAQEDFEFPIADEGTPQAVIFGDCWMEGWMVLGLGNYRTARIRTKSGK